MEALAGFSTPTAMWFAESFAQPTPAQAGAWKAIASGSHAVVVAPTGSGKTLAAFLWAIDTVHGAPPPADPLQRCRVVYVSPLKALAVDVERNLRSPLVGIERVANRLGLPTTPLTTAMRSGDTPASDRRAFARAPADILITTPESLYLIVTSQARSALAGVTTVIVDEVHTMVATKRGAHLALTLERLDALLPSPAQRIALSATVNPVTEVARWVTGARTREDGGRPVEIVAPPTDKVLDIQIQLPVADLTELDAPQGDLAGPAEAAPRRASIWPHVESRLVDLVEQRRSTLVFTNSRRSSERLTSRMNEEHARRHGLLEFEPGEVWASEVTAQSGVGLGSEPVIARAHHGSMSREERTHIENELKAGRLPAVVATSSLELGIDMGAIDLVVQVGAPPSVASGLQRIGRAGHQVGATSHAVIFPTHRGELLATLVAARRMLAGTIEPLHIIDNPLDVLAQHIVAMCALETWAVADLARVIRRAAPFANLTDGVLASVLDMLSGRYPSDDFAQLRPRLVWDRLADTIAGRPGAGHLAILSGGTIPDRGLYPVHLAGTTADARRGGKRVGELDEEMVFESRVGDVITLGTASWKIVDISPHDVTVIPQPGQPGRLPFWKADSVGRDPSFGAAIGAAARELASLDPSVAHAECRAAGLDEWAADNLVSFLTEQREATGVVPDDRTILIETFTDEIGDRRVVVHSPWGYRVNGPWALVIGGALTERWGLDAQVMAADDGIVLRLPDGAAGLDADMLLIAPDDVAQLVQDQVGGSAQFAARFREAAARALLLPRQRPGRRQPLWQQRQRASQLLSVAAAFPDFPILHEAMRECLRDDFDVPALRELMESIRRRTVRVVQAETPQPSPAARSLLFGYTQRFLYEGDAPLAERRAAALTLDPTLLAELLGDTEGAEVADLLDPAVVADLDAELARCTPELALTDPERLFDHLRVAGPLPLEPLRRASLAPDAVPGWLAELVAARRVIEIRLAGEPQWAAVEDAGRLRDGLGVGLPAGIPTAFLDPVPGALASLIRRHGATHGPFTLTDIVERFSLAIGSARTELDALVAAGLLVAGHLRPLAAHGGGHDYCDPGILRRLRRRSLAALRRQIEPVDAAGLARFQLRWQLGDALSGPDAVTTVVAQLAGAAVPASALESLVLPARIPGYTPGMLDEAAATGDITWVGDGALSGNDGYVRLIIAGSDDVMLARIADTEVGELGRRVLAVLAGGGGFLLDDIAARLEAEGQGTSSASLVETLWQLAWDGWVVTDSYAALRALLGQGHTAHRTRTPARARPMLTRRALVTPRVPIDRRAVGRWSIAPTPVAREALAALGSDSGDPDAAAPPAAHAPATSAPQRASAEAFALLERHGIVTRGTVESSFATLYPVFSALEEAGRIRRGYFVEGLGGSQFALPECVDMLREETTTGAVLLSACDPANPYGAALAWPEHPGTHRPGRKAGAVVVLVEGRLVLYLERGAATLLSFTATPAGPDIATQPAADPSHRGTAEASALAAACAELATWIARRRLGTVRIKRIDGQPALEARAQGDAVASALEAVGFGPTPSGLRMRAVP